MLVVEFCGTKFRHKYHSYHSLVSKWPGSSETIVMRYCQGFGQQ